MNSPTREIFDVSNVGLKLVPADSIIKFPAPVKVWPSKQELSDLYSIMYLA
jgi:hypothetical protein